MNPSEILKEIHEALLSHGLREEADKLDTAEGMVRKLERFADEVVADAQQDELTRHEAVLQGGVVPLFAPMRVTGGMR